MSSRFNQVEWTMWGELHERTCIWWHVGNRSHRLLYELSSHVRWKNNPNYASERGKKTDRLFLHELSLSPVFRQHLSGSKPHNNLLQLSWLVFSTGNRKCALAWRRHDAVRLIHSLLSKAEQKSSSCWDLFWPWSDPSRTQTNFLVDNKQLLSQKAVQPRVERHETHP